MDLSVIAAVLSSNVDTPIESGWCMAGEVGLSGEVRPVSRIEQRIAEAEKLGFQHMIIPKYNLSGLNTKKFKIELHPVRKVEEALRELPLKGWGARKRSLRYQLITTLNPAINHLPGCGTSP